MRILKRTLYKFVAIIVFIPYVSGMANNDTHDKFDINARNNRELEDINEEIVLECSELQEVMAFIIGCYFTIIISTIILKMVLIAHVTLTILFNFKEIQLCQKILPYLPILVFSPFSNRLNRQLINHQVRHRGNRIYLNANRIYDVNIKYEH